MMTIAAPSDRMPSTAMPLSRVSMFFDRGESRHEDRERRSQAHCGDEDDLLLAKLLEPAGQRNARVPRRSGFRRLHLGFGRHDTPYRLLRGCPRPPCQKL